MSSVFFFFFFLHLISLPVLPNGPIRKVCAIISRVHYKEKTNWFQCSSGMDNILEHNVILISLD